MLFAQRGAHFQKCTRYAISHQPPLRDRRQAGSVLQQADHRKDAFDEPIMKRRHLVIAAHQTLETKMKAADIGWIRARRWNVALPNDRFEAECQAIRMQIGNKSRSQIDCCGRDAEMVAVKGNEVGASDAVVHTSSKMVLIVQQALGHFAIAMPSLGDLQKIGTGQRQTSLRKMHSLPGDGGLRLLRVRPWKIG